MSRWASIPAADVMLADEFKAVGAQVEIATLDGSAGLKGTVAAALPRQTDCDFFFACGPKAMLKALSASLEIRGEVSLEERMGCGFGAAWAVRSTLRKSKAGVRRRSRVQLGGGNMVDTKVSLSGLVLDNPVIPASGTFGYGSVFSEFYDINILGSFSFKGTTLNPRDGNPCPRIAETKSGMLNSVGLQNPGAENVAKEELGELSKIYGKKVIANVGGFSVEEYVRCAEIFDGCEQVGLIELNISCPNVHNGGMSFGTDAKNAARVTSAVKAAVKKPVYVKLSPNVTDITEIAKACEDAGADG